MEQLPIDGYLDEIKQQVIESPVTLVESPPGSGKSTRVPPALSQEFAKTAMLQPRRVAARMVAERIAKEQSWKLGAEVGYRIRHENRTQNDTRVEVLTEGILTRHLIHKKNLNSYDLIILDEFHERSLHTDIICGWVKQRLQQNLPCPKILIMTATPDHADLFAFFKDLKVISISNKPHELEVSYASYSTPPHLNKQFSQQFSDSIISMTKSAIQRSPGQSLLTFLPGVKEIREYLGSLKAEKVPYELIELHGRLSVDQQSKALRRSDKPRIVAATNIAETSLTVPDIRIVVDSGLEKVGGFEPRTGEDYLYLQRISLASAQQRAGRAARVGPGIAYRCWAKSDEKKMAQHPQPEVMRSNLFDPFFLLLQLGIEDDFDWISKPTETAIEQCKDTFEWCGITHQGRLTDLGSSLGRYPTGVRHACLLEHARRLGCYEPARKLVSIIESRALTIPPSDHSDCDLEAILETFDSRQHGLLYRSLPSDSKANHSPEAIYRATFRAFPDRLIGRRKKNDSRGKMARGRGIKLSRESRCKKFDFFTGIQVMRFQPIQSRESDVSIASRVDRAWIVEDLGEYLQRGFTLDESNQTQVEEIRFGELLIQTGKRTPLNEQSRRDLLVKNLLDKPQSLYKSQPEIPNFLQRCDFARQDGLEIPQFGREEMKEVLILAFEDNTDPLKESPIRYFELWLSPLQLDSLNSMYPDKFLLKSPNNKIRDRQIHINYDLTRGAFIQISIQDAARLKAHPTVGRNLPLGLELLAPNRRPIQFTTNIESFWKTSYPEIKKELKGRYPKHSWP